MQAVVDTENVNIKGAPGGGGLFGDLLTKLKGKPAASNTQVEEVKGVQINAGGNALIDADQNIKAQSLQMQAGQQATVTADGNVEITSQQAYSKTQSGSDVRQNLQTERTLIQGGTGVEVYGKQSVNIVSADIKTDRGQAKVTSAGDVTLGYNTDTEQHNWTTSSSSGNVFKSKTTTSQHETLDKTAQVTQISGGQVVVLGNNVKSEGAKLDGSQLVQLEGANNTQLYAVQEVHQYTKNSQTSSGVLGITYSKSSSTDTTIKSEALGTRLTSDEAVRVGVGAVTDVQGAILTAPKVDFVRSAGADTSKDGELILGGSTNTTQTSHTEKTTTAGVYQEMSGRGETTQTLNQTQIKGKVNIANGINTTVVIPEGDFKSQVQQLSQQPGMAYIGELAKNPKVNWTQVKLAYDKWEYSQEGLTPAGAAILAIAIAAYTGGMGAELLGGTAGTAATATTAATQATLMGSTALGAAANTGFAALTSSAGVSFVNNGGDIGKTLKDMGSSQNVKGVLTAMVTAGVLTELGSTPTATGQTGANAQAISTTQAVDKFAANLMQNVTNNVASAVVSSAINGTPLNEDTLSTALSSALITAGMAQAANSIGDAASGKNPALNSYTQAMAHALAGCVGGAATTGNSGGCSAGAVGAVVGELSAKFATESGMDAGGALKLATTMSAVAGAMVGGPNSAAAVNVASQMGTNAALNNYLYHYKGKIIARDSKDNDKIINLTDDDLRKLAAENPEVLNQLIAGIGKTDAPIVVKDSSAQNMTGSSIQDLRNPNDRTAIAKESDMGYVNINGQARVFVQTGMDNTRQDAGVSAQALSKTLGGVNTGYINNGTEGLTGDVGEYLPNSLSKKDVLNEYTYRTLNAQGQTLIVTHSAGNEDARKALQAGVMYGHSYDNLSFVSLGSPVSNSVMKNSVTNAGANYLGQVNDWRDPVTYSKTAGVAVIGGGLVGVGLAGVGIVTFNPVLLYTGGSIAAGAAGAAGAGIQYVHPFEKYVVKPQSQSIMFDWLKNNPQVK
jgi:Possible hemagglutinin (DUF637)